MDRGAKSAGQRAHRAAVRDPPGPPGEGNALGGNRHDGSSESLFGDALSSGVGAALHGGASQPAQCPSTAGSRTSPGRSPECAGGPQGDRRSHRELGRKPLGRAPGRSLRGTSRSAGRNRTATRWHALAALSRPLLASDALPERTAIGKSFRPTASRTCRSKPKTPSEDQNQIPCGCQSPLEKALEEDISIWQKPGHFYFALTRICYQSSPQRGSRGSSGQVPRNGILGNWRTHTSMMRPHPEKPTSWDWRGGSSSADLLAGLQFRIQHPDKP